MPARWRKFLGGLGAGRFWAVIWLAALAVPFAAPVPLAFLTVLAWVSAVILAPGRHHGRRLLIAGALFGLFWALMLGGLHWLSPAQPLRPILNLAAWLALGLNLMLAKTPLGLALPAGRLLTPILGRASAQKLALALALVAHLVPGLLASGLSIAKTVKLRAPRLSFTRKLTLWARALTRDAFSQSDELARTLVKRWPW